MDSQKYPKIYPPKNTPPKYPPRLGRAQTPPPKPAP